MNEMNPFRRALGNVGAIFASASAFDVPLESPPAPAPAPAPTPDPALVRDAERYRALRESSDPYVVVSRVGYDGHLFEAILTGEELDEEMDKRIP